MGEGDFVGWGGMWGKVQYNLSACQSGGADGEDDEWEVHGE